MLIILLLIGALGFNGCINNNQRGEIRYISDQNNVTRLRNGTVSLIIPTERVIRNLGLNFNTVHTENTLGREHRSYCSGFFVSRTEILTAAHCVQRYRIVQGIFGQPELIPSNESPIGDIKKISTFSNYMGARQHLLVYRNYEVVQYNQRQDLALLRLARGQLPPVHYSVLRIGANPRDGEVVYSLGHPAGQDWSLTQGIISWSYRVRPNQQRYTQTSAQTYFGNSGGPLINNRGEVVGVASAIITPHLAFYVHVRSIRTFLNAR